MLKELPVSETVEPPVIVIRKVVLDINPEIVLKAFTAYTPIVVAVP